MKPVDFDRAVRQAAASLAACNVLYLSASATTLEDNVALHLGRVLLDAGFLVHADGRAGEGSRRVDLYGVQAASSTVLIGEVRRLDGHAGTGAALYDHDRLANAPAPPGMNVTRRVGLLAATCAHREYARWFSTKEARSIGPGAAVAPTAELAALEERLPNEATWGAYVIADVPAPNGQRRTEWLLYALFSLR